MSDGLTVKPTSTQAAFLASTARYPAFVGGWGSGKTMWMLLKGFALSEKYPNNQGIFFRKNFTDLRDSTMADFTRYTGLKVRSDKTVTLDNGSRILFHHLDELAGVAQNINLGWFGIEQAEELESDQVFQTLRGRLRRDNVGIHQGIVIANTNGHNWIWRLWKQDQLAQSELFEMTPFENPYLPADFIADLKQMESESPSHYRRFVLNSWEDTDTADKCIPYQKILDAVGRDLREYDADLTVISCDPAEYGNDKSVIYVLKGLGVVDQKVTSKRSIGETSGNIIKLYRKHGTDQIIVDEVGLGAGVRKDMIETFDEDQELGVVIPFNSAHTARDRIRYDRMRDQVWGHAAELFENDYVSIPDDDILIEELAAHTYSLNSKGQYKVCRKKDVKKELGHSPDKADALVMGLWAAKKGRKRELAGVGARDEEADYDPLTWEME